MIDDLRNTLLELMHDTSFQMDVKTRNVNITLSARAMAFQKRVACAQSIVKKEL